jgi:uncharacterized protein (DUF169 family)
MGSTKHDFSVFDRFNFERKPVAVKFLFDKPENIKRLDLNTRICEMLKVAQESAAPFYADKDNFKCAGASILGLHKMEDIPYVINGGLARDLEVFDEPRAAQRLYKYLPTLPKNTANYIAFSTLDKVPFDPDVLILTGTVDQAQIVLRASTYTEGKVWTHKVTPFVACSWLYIYPYTSGELNYIITGISVGMKAFEILPSGLWLIAIPFNLIPTIIQNLKDMKWDITAYTLGREKFEEYYANLRSRKSN